MLCAEQDCLLGGGGDLRRAVACQGRTRPGVRPLLPSLKITQYLQIVGVKPSVHAGCDQNPSSSIPRSFLMPLLSFCHSDMPWLAPPIPPHPEVELIQPNSIASPRTGIGNSSFAVAKSMGQGGRAVSCHKALHHWLTTQHVLGPAQIKPRQARDLAG
jgi:hypothetical protein